MNEIVERTIKFFEWRRRAYEICFPKKERSADIVLRDLMKFCHVNENCPHTDPFLIGKWMGRQEVARRFSRHLHLSPEELFALNNGVRTQPQEI